MLRKSILAATLSATLFAGMSHTALAADKKFFTVAEILPNAVTALPACLEYKVEGVEVRMKIRPTSILIFATLRVSHNNPDLMVTSHDNMFEMPWLEWQIVLGTGTEVVAETTVFTLLKQLLPGGGADVLTSGGQVRKQGYGAHQDTQFKEATIVGNPAAILIMILAGLTEQTLDGNLMGGMGNITSGWPKIDWNKFSPDQLAKLPQDALNKLKNTDWAALGDKAMDKAVELIWELILPAAVKDAVKLAMQAVEIAQMVQELYDTVMSVINGVGIGFGVRIDRFFCPSNVRIAEPYYQSGINGVLWRAGYPPTDIHKSVDIINPFSSDKIAPSSSVELWGNLYPRHGFYNHDWDYKGGTVTAARAAQIILEPGYGHIVRSPSGQGHGGWQQIHPSLETSCRKNIANTVSDSDNNQSLNYGWTWWRRYECSLAPEGELITYIPFDPPIPITPEIPE